MNKWKELYDKTEPHTKQDRLYALRRLLDDIDRADGTSDADLASTFCERAEAFCAMVPRQLQPYYIKGARAL